MKRAVTLMAMTALAGPALADDTPQVEKPRVLATGAPACGNVMFKSYVQRERDPVCAVLDNLRALEALGRKFEAELQNLDVETASLTVAPAPRPVL